MGKRNKSGKKYREIPTSPSAPRNDSANRKKSKGGAPEFEVRIRISKRPRVDHYSGDIQATDTKALIEALAVMMQKAAALIGAPVDKVYSVVATVLFADRKDDEGDCHTSLRTGSQ